MVDPIKSIRFICTLPIGFAIANSRQIENLFQSLFTFISANLESIQSHFRNQIKVLNETTTTATATATIQNAKEEEGGEME